MNKNEIDYWEAKRRQEEAVKQRNVQKKRFERDIEEVGGDIKKTMDFRLQSGEIDWSLFNLIMTVQDFTDVRDLNEAVMKMYRYCYAHMTTLQRNNEGMKDLLNQLRESGNRAQKNRIDQELAVKSPFLVAHQTLDKLKSRAKTRSKSGIISYTEEQARKEGFDL